MEKLNMGSSTMRIAIAIGLAAGHLYGQVDAKNNKTREYVDPYEIPGIFARNAKAVGDRMKNPGKERIVLTGELLLRGQRAPIAAAVELPGKVRVQYGNSNRTTVFDLEKADNTAGVDDDDEALLDIFAYDSVDSFLYSIVDGTMPRVLGYAFRVAGETGFGERVDIYEVVQQVKSRKQVSRIVKQFQFDSLTGLLRRISYTAVRNGVPVKVRTEYSQYQDFQSQKIAKRIVRREGSSVTIEVQLTQVEVQAKGNGNAFKVR